MPTCIAHMLRTGLMAATVIAGASAASAQDIVRQPLPAPSLPQPEVASQPTQIAPAAPETTGSIAPTADQLPAATPPEMAGATGLEEHLNHVQDILTDQENMSPDAIKQAEELDWSQAPTNLVDGDFAGPHDAESKIGWVAPGKKDDRPKVRKPKVDLKAMTRVKLNENGSTVLDLTKGRVIHKF